MSTENEVKDLNAMSDVELSEAFAWEVAKWRQMDACLWDVGESRVGGYNIRKRSDGVWITNEPTFATDANAVLPWIQAIAEFFDASWQPMHGTWLVRGIGYAEGSEAFSAIAATFPRAACCALIAAKRAAKGATP